MHTVDFNGQALNEGSVKDAVKFVSRIENTDGAEWVTGPEFGMAISNVSFVVSIALDKVKEPDTTPYTTPYVKRFFADTFCGLPVKYDWVAEPNTLKLFGRNGEQLLSIINLQEPVI